jgi:hypothetical protein
VALEVLVTEIRALLGVEATAARDDSESTLYRADVSARFQPTDRIRGIVGVGLSNDEIFAAGLVRRDYSEVHALARLAFDLTRNLDLNLSYRYNDSENRRPPALLRTVQTLGAALDWAPLTTVDAVLAATRRDESEEGTPLQTLDSLRLGVATQILPDLRLVSDVNLSRLDDAFAGESRDSLVWRETLDLQLLPTWTLSGGYDQLRTTSAEGQELLRRSQYRVFTSWNATAYISLGATLWITDERGRLSTNQSYNVSYSPGRKLSISGTYQGFDSSTGTGTFTDSLSVIYRFYRQLILFANLSRSRFENDEGETSQISNLRAGLRFSF